jgi:hypothetical protein
VRLAADTPLLQPPRDARFHVEPAVGQPGTVVVEVPVDAGQVCSLRGAALRRRRLHGR